MKLALMKHPALATVCWLLGGCLYLIVVAAVAEWIGNWNLVAEILFALAALVVPITLWERITGSP